MMRGNEIPRRNRISEQTPAEKAIHAAVLEVDKLPTNLQLIRAVRSLLTAADHVADYVDGIDQKT